MNRLPLIPLVCLSIICSLTATAQPDTWKWDSWVSFGECASLRVGADALPRDDDRKALYGWQVRNVCRNRVRVDIVYLGADGTVLRQADVLVAADSVKEGLYHEYYRYQAYERAAELRLQNIRHE